MTDTGDRFSELSLTPPTLERRADRLELLAVRADDHELAARSPRTRASYAGDWAHFTGWCDLVGRDVLPAQVETVRWYLSDLEAACDEHGARLYQPATLARRLAAIAAAHHDTGHPSPTRDPRVRAVLSGITRTRRHAPHQMRPLLLADLRTILAGLDHSSWPAGVAAARDAFALLAGFAGALRRSELAALTTDDLTWHPGDGPYVRIRASTDSITSASRRRRSPQSWASTSSRTCSSATAWSGTTSSVAGTRPRHPGCTPKRPERTRAAARRRPYARPAERARARCSTPASAQHTAPPGASVRSSPLVGDVCTSSRHGVWISGRN